MPPGVSPATSPCQLTTPRAVSRASATATRLSVRPPPATLPRSSSHSSTQVSAAGWNLAGDVSVRACMCVVDMTCVCDRCVCHVCMLLVTGVYDIVDRCIRHVYMTLPTGVYDSVDRCV